VAKIHPALLVLILARDKPNILLNTLALQRELQRLGFSVTRRMCYNYLVWLLREGYVYVIEDAKGKRVEFTDKARAFLAQLLGGGNDNYC